MLTPLLASLETDTMHNHLFTVCLGYLELALAEGKPEEEDRIRDSLDLPWYKLTPEEQELAGQFAILLNRYEDHLRGKQT